MATIKEYEISVPQSKIDLLHKKIDMVDWPSELENVGFDFGSPL